VQTLACAALPETERAPAQEPGLVSSQAGGNSPEFASEVSRTSSSDQAHAQAQQILLQIPLGAICGAESACSAAREHKVMLLNTFTDGELQYVDFRVVLGPKGSLPSVDTLTHAASVKVLPETSPCPQPPLARPNMDNVNTSVNCVSVASMDVSPAKSPCPRPPGLWCAPTSPCTEAKMATRSQNTQSFESDKKTQLAGNPCRPLLSLTPLKNSTSCTSSLPRGTSDMPAKSHMVCRHWKTKGWCKYQASCKFLHPEHKRGVGAALTESVSLPVGRVMIPQSVVLPAAFVTA